MKKQATPKPPEKFYFDLKIDSMIPATLIYKRVLAETPEEALKLIARLSPSNIQYRIPGKRDRKITIYNAGTLMVRFVKNIMGF